ncbi:hypothetical protein BJ170DRAFT_263799 [Xylariales sp. AK1849]|nr:hypothetical protein BJ170DRAFT_263799 [Xylariales sp. AK1849]
MPEVAVRSRNNQQEDDASESLPIDETSLEHGASDGLVNDTTPFDAELPVETLSKKPKTRQRRYKQPPALALPDINDDASERKRVLNVLAQRRYRQRKRHGKSHRSPSGDFAESSASVNGNEVVAVDSWNSSLPRDGAQAEKEPVHANPLTGDVSPPGLAPLLNLDIQACWPPDIISPTISNLLGGIDEPAAADLEGTESTVNMTTTDPIIPSMTTSEAFDLGFSNLLNLSYVDTLVDLSTNGPGPVSPMESAEQLCFPDTYLLPVPELKLLQAFLRIATSMRCKSSPWDLNAVSPFNDPTSVVPPELPASWAPTVSQSTVPHHPLLDLLPWPSARDRIIDVFSLPDDLRPPGAGGPLALVQFVYDMEDSGEGMRIWGGSPCDPTTWEVGQLLFERWWFIFDRHIIEQSNRWRRLRGAATLRLNGAVTRATVEDLTG